MDALVTVIAVLYLFALVYLVKQGAGTIKE